MQSDEIEAWKQANELFEHYIDQSLTSALADIEKKEISSKVKNILIKLLKSQPQENTLIDNIDLSYFSSLEEPVADMTGKDIDEYHLLEQIGKGGMSAVYKAKRHDKAIQKYVAIKILIKKIDQSNAALVKLFEQEQMTLAKLHHKNIVSLHHGDISADGIAYLVTEYIDSAKVISEFCQTKKLNTRAIINLVLPIIDAIAYAHQQLIIHRDIKPSNIIVDSHGVPYLLDFGIASIIDSIQKQQTLNIYTPDYASPEQIENKRVSIATDIFSFTASLLNLLTEKKPLPSPEIKNYDSDNDRIHVNKLLQGSKLDVDLQNILRKGLAIKPENRYQSMLELKMDLLNWQQFKPVSASKHSSLYLFKKFMHRNPVSTVLVSGLLLAIFASLFFMFKQMQQANFEAKKAQLVTDFLIESIQSSDPDISKGEDISVKEFLKNAKFKIQETSMLDAMLRSSLEKTIGTALAKVGAYQDAENLLLKAIESDVNNYDARLSLMQLYNEQKDYEKQRYHFDFLVKNSNKLSSGQQIILQQIHAKQLLQKTQFSKAIDVIEKTLAIQSIDAKLIISSQLILAQILDENSESKKAVKVLEQALQFSQKEFGEQSSITTTIYQKLTKYITNFDDVPYQRVIALYKKMIKIQSKIYGNNHPILAKTYLQYGFLLKIIAKTNEAKKYAQMARIISLNNFGENHILTAHCDLLLSQLLLIESNINAATQKLENIIPIYAKTYGENHFETNQVKTTLAFYYLMAKQAGKALYLLLPLYESQKQQLGIKNKATLYVVVNILKAYGLLDEHDKAIKLGEQTLPISQQQFGKSFAITIGIQANLAENYLAKKEYTKAKSLLLPLLDMAYVKNNAIYLKKIQSLIDKIIID